MKNAQLQHPGIKSQPIQLPMQLTTAPQARMRPTLSLIQMAHALVSLCFFISFYCPVCCMHAAEGRKEQRLGSVINSLLKMVPGN